MHGVGLSQYPNAKCEHRWRTHHNLLYYKLWVRLLMQLINNCFFDCKVIENTDSLGNMHMPMCYQCHI